MTNKRTDWDLFRNIIEKTITLSARLKSSTDIEVVVQKLTNYFVQLQKWKQLKLLKAVIKRSATKYRGLV